MNLPDCAEDGPPRAAFGTTRWSLVLAAGSHSHPDSAQALEALCGAYWYPLYTYIRRRGHSAADAQDLTQDFFAMILQTNWLRHADRRRGRFRSLLLRSLENFLHDAADKRDARKRGGSVTFVSWDDWMAEAPSHLTLPAATLDAMPADQLFDLRWAATVVEQALGRLGEECERKGRRRLFDVLSSHLAAERGDVCYAKLAAGLGVGEAAIKRLLYNMRQRYRWLLRDEVARTVGDSADIDDEIRHLCAALGAASG